MAEENELDEIESEDSVGNQFLTFCLDKETYAIDLLAVMEIIRLTPITPVPEAYSFVKGIINLRGKIIPVMDVRLRFGLEEKAYQDRTCIIVVIIDRLEIGLLVDSVTEVMEIPSSQMEVLPNVNATSQRFVKGIGKVNDSIKLVLDLERLLFDEEVQKLKTEALT